MKISIITDSTGTIIGTAWLGYHSKEKSSAEAEQPICEAGIVAEPGQSVVEAEVPDELMQLEEVDIHQKLKELDVVKQALSPMVTAGQEDSHSLQMVTETPEEIMVTAGREDSHSLEMITETPEEIMVTAGQGSSIS